MDVTSTITTSVFVYNDTPIIASDLDANCKAVWVGQYGALTLHLRDAEAARKLAAAALEIATAWDNQTAAAETYQQASDEAQLSGE